MRIKWNGKLTTRVIHGYRFEPGQVIEVEDKDIALDILTQPGEPFVQVASLVEDENNPEPAPPAKVIRRKPAKQEE